MTKIIKHFYYAIQLTEGINTLTSNTVTLKMFM